MKLLFGSHVPSLFTLFILLILHTSSGIHILLILHTSSGTQSLLILHAKAGTVDKRENITKLLSLFKSQEELFNRTVTGDPNLTC
jgi:hypothetical protein